MKKWMTGIALLAAISMSFTGAAFAAEETAPENGTEVKEEMKTLGVRDTDSLMLELINKTGADISYIAIEPYDPAYYPNGDVIRLQEALIEQGYLDDVADGSFGPKTQGAVDAFRAEKNLDPEGGADEEMLTLLYGTYDDGNLLKDEDIFAADESRLVYVSPAKEEEAQEQDSEDALAEVLKSFEITPQYLVTFRLADEEQEYVVHSLVLDGSVRAELHVDNDLAYLIYAEVNGDPLSTQEIEQAVYDAEHPAPADNSYAEYDDYGDYDYYEPDYYDPGYYEPYYEEPVYAGDGCIEDPLFNP